MLLNVRVFQNYRRFISKKSNILSKNILGTIFGVQSKNTFLVKLLPERPSIKLFDFVRFCYSVDQRNRYGLVFDVYLLNEQQWIKVLSNREIENIFSTYTTAINDLHSDVVYKMDEIPGNDYTKRFVGIITENSSINKIRFIYNSKLKCQNTSY